MHLKRCRNCMSSQWASKTQLYNAELFGSLRQHPKKASYSTLWSVKVLCKTLLPYLPQLYSRLVLHSSLFWFFYLAAALGPCVKVCNNASKATSWWTSSFKMPVWNKSHGSLFCDMQLKLSSYLHLQMQNSKLVGPVTNLYLAREV